MFNINKQKSTHGARLERWLGAETVARLSDSMKNWYGPPIAVAGVPGNVWAHKGGDFQGVIKSGQFMPAVDFGLMRLKKAMRVSGQRSRQNLNMGFSSLSDLIAEATGGKMSQGIFTKTGTAGATAASNTLWNSGVMPTAGVIGSAAPGGRVPDGTTTGAFPGLQNVSPDTRHLVSGNVFSSLGSSTLLLYDRIFDVAKTMNSVATESVTGVPTRYQGSTVGDADYAGGNFCFIEVITTIPGTAHNWTVCRYRNQAGTDQVIFPTATGTVSLTAGRLDHIAGSWYLTLDGNDTGVKDLDQMQCSALVASGTIDFVIGHPIAWFPCPVANMACTFDGINTAFNLARIFDGACLSLLDVWKPSASASGFTGQFTMAHG